MLEARPTPSVEECHPREDRTHAKGVSGQAACQPPLAEIKKTASSLSIYDIAPTFSEAQKTSVPPPGGKVATSEQGLIHNSLSRRDQSNLFSRMTLFFHPEQGKESIRSVLSCLLADMVKRDIYSFPDIVNHLRHFRLMRGDDVMVGLFASAVMDAATVLPAATRTSREMAVLAQLAARSMETLHDLATEICWTTQATHEPSFRLQIMDLCLQLVGRADRPRDAPAAGVEVLLPLGETLLVLAARLRHPQLLHLLLRHGADPRASWLGFRGVAEVLLLSPHLVHVSRQDKANTEVCLGHIHAASGTLACRGVTPLEAPASAEDLTLLWPVAEVVAMLPEGCLTGPPSLLHLTRLSIRQRLLHNRQLPHGLSALPLPATLISYLDFM